MKKTSIALIAAVLTISFGTMGTPKLAHAGILEGTAVGVAGGILESTSTVGGAAEMRDRTVVIQENQKDHGTNTYRDPAKGK